MIVETVVALLMIIHGEIKEHRIQESMAACLRGKRTAERSYSSGTKYQCLKAKAELELVGPNTASLWKKFMEERNGLKEECVNGLPIASTWPLAQLKVKCIYSSNGNQSSASLELLML